MSDTPLEQDELPPTVGWDGISQRLEALYPGQEPQHFGTIISYSLGGNDPLDGISVYKNLEPLPHWHFVTYGFSELYAKENDNAQTSGFGFELTFRLACAADEAHPPTWAMNFLQNLARYVFGSGNVFRDGDWMPANGPIARDQPTQICSMAFISDPQLPELDTANGSLTFLQVVGLTDDEEQAAKRWRTHKLLDVLLPYMPLWITDLERESLLDRGQVRQQIAEGLSRDGSASGYLYTDLLHVTQQERLLRSTLTCITLAARQADELLALLPLRLPFGKPFLVAGADWQLRFVAGEQDQLQIEDQLLTLTLTPASLDELLRTLKPQAGEYRLAGFKGLEWQLQ